MTDGGIRAEVRTYATVSSEGDFARVDLVNGGRPVHGGGESLQPGDAQLQQAQRAFLQRLMSTAGLDVDGDLADTDADGIADSGFDVYHTGLAPGAGSARILGANNLYDLFQTTSGAPVLSHLAAVGPPIPGGPPFTGGDVNFDGLSEGGPGHFRNFAPTNAIVPPLPELPNTMGQLHPDTGSGRGPSATDEHQFIQIEFPYRLDVSSLFDFTNVDGSFLGDGETGERNVTIEARWVSRAGAGDVVNIVDHTDEHRHVSGVAVIGGVAAVPATAGFSELASVDVERSRVPAGARALIGRPNVLTYIAHERPSAISRTSGPSIGWIEDDGTLVLPDPSDPAGRGGRVFGANELHPSSVNDWETDGDADAARIGFVLLEIASLRTAGKTVRDPYFHTFPVSQRSVGSDPMAVAGSFDRGPAIDVDRLSGRPAIDVLAASDLVGPVVAEPISDVQNTISTRARFRVDFDKEVIPNSVGFSRRHTIHRLPGFGVVFPFNGNTRPVASPASLLVPGSSGAPVAPSIYLALNQPAAVAVNNPFAKAALGPSGSQVMDDGSPLLPEVSADDRAARNGLYPHAFNTLATLPRGIVPCDVRPLDQNNLQSYVVEPLVDLPPGSIVTLGVCMQGLGYSNNALTAPTPGRLPSVPFGPPTNHGNSTRSGTLFSGAQALSAVGLPLPSPANSRVLANHALIKVNAGPMDLRGQLFFGGTSVAVDTLIDGDVLLPSGVRVSNDLTDGGWNVSRTFRVGHDLERPYVNAPVAPQALVVGFGGVVRGAGVVDLSGTGFPTNAPQGALENAASSNHLLVSRALPFLVAGAAPLGEGLSAVPNWDPFGSLLAGHHQRAFGVLGRFTAGPWADGSGAISWESDLAVGRAIPTGPLTPTPGVNEGSSGYETLVRDSFGSPLLTDDEEIGQVRDVVLGDFLDTVFFDRENPHARSSNHRTYNAPGQTDVANNTIADPPLPNPPPLRFPVGLPHTAVLFDQDDLLRPPVLINGNEVLPADGLLIGAPPVPANGLIQLDPNTNSSNGGAFDALHPPGAGFPSPFGANTVSHAQTGPLPKTSTSPLAALASVGGGSTTGQTIPAYQSRQQIGNFLFVADGVNRKLHAVNSNTMDVVRSLSLPDPFGLGLTPDLSRLFVSNEGNATVSEVDVDPRSPGFMTEIKRIPVGAGPRAVAVSPDSEDVFVLNRLDNSISIIDAGTSTVRRTIASSGIDRPSDVCLGMREVALAPGFQSQTYHGFISNEGADNVLVYESGPSGVAGIGFDNILGVVTPNAADQIGSPLFADMESPRGIVWDNAIASSNITGAFGGTIGCFVAHQDPVTGRALVSRIAYTKDSAPGPNLVFGQQPNFGQKVFEVIQQYHSNLTGPALDVALPDFSRSRMVASDFFSDGCLFNCGAVQFGLPGALSVRSSKYPLAAVVDSQGMLTVTPRWRPDRLYLAVGSGAIEVFDIETGQHRNTIPTPASPTVLASYFSQ